MRHCQPLQSTFRSRAHVRTRGRLRPSPLVRAARGTRSPRLRRPILTAAAASIAAGAALVGLALGHAAIAVTIFVAFALLSLFAWTHAAVVAARRLQPIRAHAYLAFVVLATMLIMTVAAAVWFASVTAHAPSFVGTAQLALVATFMLTGNLVAVGGLRSLRA